MDAPALRLAMVAGEASGDLLAALLIGGLRERWPGLALAGIGGPRMTALGFDAHSSNEAPSDRIVSESKKATVSDSGLLELVKRKAAH